MTFLTDLDDLIRHHHGDVKKLREIRDTIRHDNFITSEDKNDEKPKDKLGELKKVEVKRGKIKKNKETAVIEVKKEVQNKFDSFKIKLTPPIKARFKKIQ